MPQEQCAYMVEGHQNQIKQMPEADQTCESDI